MTPKREKMFTCLRLAAGKSLQIGDVVIRPVEGTGRPAVFEISDPNRRSKLLGRDGQPRRRHDPPPEVQPWD